MGQKLSIKFSGSQNSYDIVAGELRCCGGWALRCLGATAKKVVIISNAKVFKLYGSETATSLQNAGFDTSHFLIGDGERFKTMRSAESVIKFFSEKKLFRNDAVIALGGGVVGDLAGFAAAIHLRGTRFLQIPTTLLSMVDSSVGGKTGVNTAAGKNFIGSFHQPSGVLIDTATLKTLPQREVTAGLCEMVKHSALSGRSLFRQTSKFLSRYWPRDFLTYNDSNFRSEISNLILENIHFKAGIVAGDECESTMRKDSRSRKILNFGHTLAHALEKVTDYKRFKHGEAVGYGMLFAAELSKRLAFLAEKDVNLLNDVLHRVGPLPPLAGIEREEVFRAFRSDKKQAANGLQMVLLKGIGKPIIVDEREIPKRVMQASLKKLFNERA